MPVFRGGKRKKLLQTPLSVEQDALLRQKVPLYERIPHIIRPRLQGAAQVLLAEKNFEGCDGLQISEQMRLIVASQAALLQLRSEADHFPQLDSILIYPDTFVVNHPLEIEPGIVSEQEQELAGESWQRGVVILSWRDITEDLENPGSGYNVILHEFAHQLDDEHGGADGAPLLPAALSERWADCFAEAYARHCRRAGRGQGILFDEDAADDPAEFFATSVELFFELPGHLRREFADLYAVLRDYLQLDPAEWTRPPAAES